MNPLSAVTKVIPGGTLLSGAALVADLIPLIHDVFKKPEVDQDHLQKVKAARDGLAARLAAQEGIPLDRATKMVNEQLEPVIAEAEQPKGGASAGEIAGDAAGLGITAYLAHKGGLLGKGSKAAATEAAATAKSGAPMAAPTRAAYPAPMQPDDRMGDLQEMMVQARKRSMGSYPAPMQPDDRMG